MTPTTDPTAVTAAAAQPIPPSDTPTPAAPTATRTLASTPTPIFTVCSPLEDITLSELGQPDLLKNPFDMPRPGMDDGHHGADFAYWSRGAHTTMLGLPIHSVLSGRVAGVILNRQPYGNAIIIETPLEDAQPAWLKALAVPTPAPTVPASASLQCPADTATYNTARRSLYLLYAHMNQPAALKIGDPVSCGDPIGQVGTTGKSVNAHLHLETRVGPAGATFPHMAHYETSATNEDMATYCTWRVSGLFQMFDPMKVLSLQP
jgi:murein DD-endopeptidase MepM/ murein hydrolase activator NlpD